MAHPKSVVPMHPTLFAYLGALSLTGDVAADAARLLTETGHGETAAHSRRVAAGARRLAQQWHVDATRAHAAAWLHDISAVISMDRRLPLAESLGLNIIPEERRAPVLVHQKLSSLIARDAFGIIDAAVLSAIGCHTTLKADSSTLDRAVFVADKRAWDQAGDPPYRAALERAAEQGPGRGALCYLEYLRQRREILPAFHLWAAEAYQQLSTQACGAGNWKR